jgi:hypothetical protein
MKLTAADIARFWSKVDKGGTCWEWTAGCCEGYGNFWHAGKGWGAHVVAFVIREGREPVIGKFVLHTCDNRRCVLHIYEGTPADNIHDMDTRGRRNTEAQRLSVSILNEQAVRDIREYYARGDVTQQTLAEVFGVSLMTINKVVRRMSWAHVT